MDSVRVDLKLGILLYSLSLLLNITPLPYKIIHQIMNQ